MGTNKFVFRNDSEEKDDWIKALPGHKDEVELSKKKIDDQSPITMVDWVLGKKEEARKRVYPKVIAKRGSDDFLLLTKKDYGRVFIRSEKKLYPETFIHSIIARGYWDEWKGTQAESDKIIDEAMKAEVLNGRKK